MAGVGFELKKLFSRQGILAGLRAYGYSGAVCAGPMLLGVGMQRGLQALSTAFGRPVHQRELMVCMMTYPLLASLGVTSCFSLAVTRWLADLLFEGKRGGVMPAFWGSVGLMLALGSAPFALLLWWAGAGWLEGFLCWTLFGELTLCWNAMNCLTAVKDYRGILCAFAAGAAAALGLGALGLWLGLPTVAAALGAACCGYGLMLVWDLRLLCRCFPRSEGSPLDVLQSCDRFRPLLGVGLCLYLGLFGHIVLMWFGPLRVQVEGGFVGAPGYDLPALLAFLTALVTTVNFVVSVEVNFYPRYYNYYALFNDGGCVGDLDAAGREMRTVLSSELWYAGLKQLFATALAISLGSVLLDRLPLGLTDQMQGSFRILCVGYGLYAVGNAALLLLLYFTDYRGALGCAAVFAGASGLFTLVSLWGRPAYFGFGFVLGAALFFGAAVLRLDWFARRLPYFILSRQPLAPRPVQGAFTRLGQWLGARKEVRHS